MLARSPSYKWYVIAMLWWIAFFNYADRQAVYSMFPLLSHEFGLNKEQLGWLGSSFAWVYALSGPLAGTVVDRIRRKTAILSGLQAWSIVCMFTALSRNFPQLLFFRAAEGLGEAIYFPASMSLISDYHGKKTRSRAMGTHQTSVFVGIIAGGSLAGWIGQRYGWRAPFVIFGFCGVLLGAVLMRLLVEPARGAADREDLGVDALAAVKPPIVSMGQFLHTALRTPTIVLLMAAFFCENFTAMVLFTWMPTFLYEKFHLGLAEASFVATIYVQTTSMLGSPLGGWVADTVRARLPGGRILVQASGILFETPFAILCALSPSLHLVILSLLLWGLCKGFYEANIFASVFDVIRPEARGTATGFMNMIGWLGGGAAPVVVGHFADRFGLGHAIAFASSSYVVASILLFVAALGFARRDTQRLTAALAVQAVP